MGVWSKVKLTRSEAALMHVGATNENGHFKGAHIRTILAPRLGLERGICGLTTRRFPRLTRTQSKLDANRIDSEFPIELNLNTASVINSGFAVS